MCLEIFFLGFSVWCQSLFNFRIYDSKFIASWGCFGNRNTTDWNNRLRFQITRKRKCNWDKCSFDKFQSIGTKIQQRENQRNCVFSTRGLSGFSSSVALQLHLKNESTLSVASFVNTVAKNIYNYPNPCVQNHDNCIAES
jgi:hypothetical protein